MAGLVLTFWQTFGFPSRILHGGGYFSKRTWNKLTQEERGVRSSHSFSDVHRPVCPESHATMPIDHYHSKFKISSDMLHRWCNSVTQDRPHASSLLCLEAQKCRYCLLPQSASFTSSFIWSGYSCSMPHFVPANFTYLCRKFNKSTRNCEIVSVLIHLPFPVSPTKVVEGVYSKSQVKKHQVRSGTTRTLYSMKTQQKVIMPLKIVHQTQILYKMQNS